MRLIDADDLVEKRYDADCWSDCQDPDWVVDWEDIENAPTIDAVEVVRCKDCTRSGLVRGDIVYCRHEGAWRKLDYFCADGEVKSDESDKR